MPSPKIYFIYCFYAVRAIDFRHTGQSRRQPVHDAIDEAAIKALVHGFYARVREDAELAPIFARAVDDWDSHLARMCDFWSSVMLMSGRYKGNPMQAHMRQKAIRPEHFACWLALFGATAQELFSPEVSALLIARAENIARSLKLGLFFRADAVKPAKAG